MLIDFPEPSEKELYPRIHITNEADYEIRGRLDALEDQLLIQDEHDHDHVAKAAQGFQDILSDTEKKEGQQSPRVRFGLARCHKIRAQKHQASVVRGDPVKMILARRRRPF